MSAYITYNDFNQLVVTTSYEHKNIVTELGAKWSPIGKQWLLAFTPENLEALIDGIPSAVIDSRLEAKLEDLMKRFDEIKRIKELAKQDAPVELKIPGWKYENGEPYNYQKIGALFAKTNGSGVLIGDIMGLGKEVSVDTPILSIDGWKRIGDINVGDLVFSRDGMAYPVTGVFPQGEKELLNMTFSDGIVSECGWDHLWMAKTNDDNNWRVVTTKEISESLYHVGSDGYNTPIWQIPLCEPIQYEGKDNLLIHPYVLGVMIAETNLLGLETKDESNRIPSEYMTSSVENRKMILAGILDTDGSMIGPEFTSSSKGLCEDIAALVRSLGGMACMTNRSSQEKDCYALTITTDFNPFLKGAKSDRWRKSSKTVRNIVNIRPVRRAEAVCISVASPDNTYIINDFVVTHNTSQALATSLLMKHEGKAKRVLIVAPASLKFNWALEIEKWTHEKYVVIDGTPDERLAQWLRDDVFYYVVNYNLLQEDLFGGREYKEGFYETEEKRKAREVRQEKFAQRTRILASVRDRVYDLLIADEVHYAKNPSSKQTMNLRAIKAKMKIGLSGTPLDGRLEELHSVMEFIQPGLLGSRTRFLQKHAETDFFGRIVSYKNIGEVKKKIDNFFIRRLKEQVLKDLPEKTYNNIIVELSKEEMKMYKELVKRAKGVTENAEAMTALMRCRQLCNGPKHLLKALRRTAEETGQPFDKEIERRLENMPNSKLAAFDDILQEIIVENSNKMIIFSESKEYVEIACEHMREKGLKFLVINGDTDKKLRADYQKIFNEDKSIDAIIGTDAMSTGLNLVGANFVLHLSDCWSPSIMDQRESRALRIGQKNAVTVINLICRDTVEERVRSVLYSKSRVSSDALGDGLDDSLMKRIDPREVSKLL